MRPLDTLNPVKKQKEVLKAQPAFFFPLHLGAQPIGQGHPQSEWVFSPQVKLQRHVSWVILNPLTFSVKTNGHTYRPAYFTSPVPSLRTTMKMLD